MWSRSNCANSRRIGTSRRLPPLPCRMVITRSARLTSSTPSCTKRQQMQWTKRGAHLLLQIWTRTLDGTLRPLFERWYPGLANDNNAATVQAAAGSCPSMWWKFRWS
jgi:hypothetical protein